MGKKIEALIQKNLEMVSIVTPTFNRRKFIPNLIRCIEAQTYTNYEWIILDDGDDKIGDLVKHLPYVRYHSYEKKIPIGEKRNLGNSMAHGGYIMYADDDDYHQPTRIEHSLDALKKNPAAFIAGSSSMYIYYKTRNELYKTIHFHDKHLTAGTFFFRKSLLNITKFDNKAAMSEEKFFLKEYRINVAQIAPESTIVINCHEYNTFDKNILLGSKGIETTDKYITDLCPDWFFS